MVGICGGTPSEADGGVNMEYVRKVLGQIGGAMARLGHAPLIVLRSTSLPGTTERLAVPELEDATGRKAGDGFDIVFHPEFLREGTAVADFDDPPKIVVGTSRPGAEAPLLKIYENYPGPRFVLSPGEAEMVKYCDNLFHALKLTFANEVAMVAHHVGVDSRKVAEVYCADTKLNISPRYLRPGFAYGGSCLPKDLKAILRFAGREGIVLPMLNGMLASNAGQIDGFVRRVMRHEPRRAGLVGLAFKANTDDMRESPYLEVAKRLTGEGVEVRVFDPCVDPKRLIGANREMVRKALRHLEDRLVDRAEDLDDCDVVIVNHGTVDAGQVSRWLDAGIRVIDVANIEGVDRGRDGYEGIYW
jgi:GDP-mannose 6-dehydrogenase